ncbi:MAG: exodeoxyribonuclease VII small subunit [Chitinophagaceae bacterium]|nr:exodeoxyribonuclease VII small subunit [Chitinophagaceae bacterium]
MKRNLTFDKAFSDLTKLVNQIEDDKIQVDTLSEKVKEANELIKFCESKLKTIDSEIKRKNK